MVPGMFPGMKLLCLLSFGAVLLGLARACPWHQLQGVPHIANSLPMANLIDSRGKEVHADIPFSSITVNTDMHMKKMKKREMMFGDAFKEVKGANSLSSLSSKVRSNMNEIQAKASRTKYSITKKDFTTVFQPNDKLNKFSKPVKQKKIQNINIRVSMDSNKDGKSSAKSTISTLQFLNNESNPPSAKQNERKQTSTTSDVLNTVKSTSTSMNDTDLAELPDEKADNQLGIFRPFSRRFESFQSPQTAVFAFAKKTFAFKPKKATKKRNNSDNMTSRLLELLSNKKMKLSTTPPPMSAKISEPQIRATSLATTPTQVKDITQSKSLSPKKINKKVSSERQKQKPTTNIPKDISESKSYSFGTRDVENATFFGWKQTRLSSSLSRPNQLTVLEKFRSEQQKRRFEQKTQNQQGVAGGLSTSLVKSGNPEDSKQSMEQLKRKVALINGLAVISGVPNSTPKPKPEQITNKANSRDKQVSQTSKASIDNDRTSMSSITTSPVIKTVASPKSKRQTVSKQESNKRVDTESATSSVKANDIASKNNKDLIIPEKSLKFEFPSLSELRTAFASLLKRNGGGSFKNIFNNSNSNVKPRSQPLKEAQTPAGITTSVTIDKQVSPQRSIMNRNIIREQVTVPFIKSREVGLKTMSKTTAATELKNRIFSSPKILNDREKSMTASKIANPRENMLEWKHLSNKGHIGNGNSMMGKGQYYGKSKTGHSDWNHFNSGNTRGNLNPHADHRMNGHNSPHDLTVSFLPTRQSVIDRSHAGHTGHSGPYSQKSKAWHGQHNGQADMVASNIHPAEKGPTYSEWIHMKPGFSAKNNQEVHLEFSNVPDINSKKGRSHHSKPIVNKKKQQYYEKYTTTSMPYGNKLHNNFDTLPTNVPYPPTQPYSQQNKVHDTHAHHHGHTDHGSNGGQNPVEQHVVYPKAVYSLNDFGNEFVNSGNTGVADQQTGSQQSKIQFYGKDKSAGGMKSHDGKHKHRSATTAANNKFDKPNPKAPFIGTTMPFPGLGFSNWGTTPPMFFQRPRPAHNFYNWFNRAFTMMHYNPHYPGNQNYNQPYQQGGQQQQQRQTTETTTVTTSKYEVAKDFLDTYWLKQGGETNLDRTVGQDFRQRVIPIQSSPLDNAPPAKMIMWKVRSAREGTIYEYAKIFPYPELIYVFSSYNSAILIDYHYHHMAFKFALPGPNGIRQGEICFVTKAPYDFQRAEAEILDRESSKTPLEVAIGQQFYVERNGKLKPRQLDKMAGPEIYHFCDDAVKKGMVFKVLNEPAGDVGGTQFTASGLLSGAGRGLVATVTISLHNTIQIPARG